MQLDFSIANEEALNQIISLLVDDPLGQARESAIEEIQDSSYSNYLSAFKHIVNDPNNELIVVYPDFEPQKVIGVLQLTYIPSLTYQGSWRAQIEGVRVHPDFRGQSIGEQLFEWSINRAKERGCRIVQLTSDKRRPDAIRFYEKLGFNASHEGFKLHLE